MSFYIFCVFFLISSANSQSERNTQELKKEMMKWNARLSYVIDEIDQLKANCSSGGQESQLSTDLKKSNELNEALKSEMEAMKQELSKLVKRDSLMEKSVSVTKPSIHFRLLDEYHTKEPDYTWQLKDMKAQLNRTEFELLSDVFPLRGYPVGGQVKLTLKDNYFYVTLAYKNLYGNALELKIAPSVHFTFKSQNASDVTRHYTSPFKASLHYDTFYYEREVVASPHEAIEVHVEGPWASQQALSQDGSLTWVIDEYRKKKQMEKEELVYYQLSPYFYSGPKGYRVQAYVRLNGHSWNNKKGITVTMDFVSGPYDQGLNASFPHRTTFTILHPTDPSKHLVESVDANIDEMKWYHIRISTHEEIEKLIENDTLRYQINIEPKLNIEPNQ